MDKYVSANMHRYRDQLSFDKENLPDAKYNQKRCKTRDKRFKSNMNVSEIQID